MHIYHEQLIRELRAAGLKGPISIDGSGARIKGVSQEDVDNVVAAHKPENIDSVTMPSMPDISRLAAELESIGVSGRGFILPSSFPGVVKIKHDPITKTVRKKISAVVASHSGISAEELITQARIKALDKVTKREMLEAILDPTKLKELRVRLE